MAFEIYNIEGELLKTVESQEEIQAIFDDLSINIFWDDEGLVESLKENHDDVSNIQIVKRV